MVLFVPNAQRKLSLQNLHERCRRWRRHGRSEVQIRNRINNPAINNPINSQIAKLNGTRKLRNAITNPIYNRLLKRRRDAESRARLRTLMINIIVLTRISILRRVYAMKRTKIFDPPSSGWDDSWRTFDWLARNCLDFSFYIGLTKQEVLEVLSQVHQNLETFRSATKRGSMNRHMRQWTGPKNRPVLQWPDGRVITAK